MRVPRTLILVALTSLCVLSFAYGRPGPQRQRGPQLQDLKATGTIKGLRPRVLHVTVEGTQQREWLVSVPERAEDLVFEATATPKWLQKRMPVRFTAKVVKEKRMREIVIREPVAELTVAPLRPDVGMGVFPEQRTDQRDNLFTRRSKTPQKKRSRAEPEEVECMIVGRVVENKDGRLRIAAGNISVRLELAPKAEISVQWHDLQWVRLGDKVDLTARYAAGRPGQAQGQTMTITAAKPLDVEEKAVRGRRKASDKGKSDDLEKAKIPD